MEVPVQEFNWGTFWQAASAIATTAAVFVALWQSIYSNRKKVKIRFRDNVRKGDALDTEPYVELEVVNTGNRKVILSRYGIIFNGNVFAIAFPDESEMISILNPIELEVEECTRIEWKKSEFIKQLQEQCKISNNSKVTLFVQDTTGTMYTYETSKRRIQYINEYNESIQKDK